MVYFWSIDRVCIGHWIDAHWKVVIHFRIREGTLPRPIYTINELLLFRLIKSLLYGILFLSVVCVCIPTGPLVLDIKALMAAHEVHLKWVLLSLLQLGSTKRSDLLWFGQTMLSHVELTQETLVAIVIKDAYILGRILFIGHFLNAFETNLKFIWKAL